MWQVASRRDHDNCVWYRILGSSESIPPSPTTTRSVNQVDTLFHYFTPDQLLEFKDWFPVSVRQRTNILQSAIDHGCSEGEVANAEGNADQAKVCVERAGRLQQQQLLELSELGDDVLRRLAWQLYRDRCSRSPIPKGDV